MSVYGLIICSQDGAKGGNLLLLFVVSAYPPDQCGVGDYTKRVVSTLRAKSSEKIGVFGPKRSILGLPANPNWGLAALIRFVKVLHGQKVETIILEYPAANDRHSPVFLGIVALGRVFKRKVVIHLHEYTRVHILRKLMIRGLSVFAHSIIVTDIIQKDAIQGFFKGPIDIVPIASNIDDGEGSPTRNPLNGLNLAFFGFGRGDKGLNILLEAMRKVHDTMPITLTLIGNIPEQTEPWIKCTGYASSEDVKKYLTETDLAVFPYEDGLSERRGSFLAAMYLGVPCLVSRPTVPVSGLKDGVNVYYCDPDAQSFATAIDVILNKSTDERETVGENGKTWYENRRSWLEIARQIEAIANHDLNRKVANIL